MPSSVASEEGGGGGGRGGVGGVRIPPVSVASNDCACDGVREFRTAGLLNAARSCCWLFVFAAGSALAAPDPGPANSPFRPLEDVAACVRVTIKGIKKCKKTTRLLIQ